MSSRSPRASASASGAATTNDESLETTPNSAALPELDVEESESTGLMKTGRSVRLTRELRTDSLVLLAAVKISKLKEVPPPTWFEGTLFVLLDDQPCVSAGLIACMLAGGAGLITSNLITASCGSIAAGGLVFFWAAMAYSLFACGVFGGLPHAAVGF